VGAGLRHRVGAVGIVGLTGRRPTGPRWRDLTAAPEYRLEIRTDQCVIRPRSPSPDALGSPG
jgi:hypothetical protein